MKDLWFEKSIYQTCLEFLMIEIYKCLKGLSPQIMSDIFKLRKNIHNLKYFHIFESQNARTKRYGLSIIPYRTRQILHTVSILIRESILLKFFKHKVKTCYCNSCPCYRKPYIIQSLHCVISLMVSFLSKYWDFLCLILCFNPQTNFNLRTLLILSDVSSVLNKEIQTCILFTYVI